MGQMHIQRALELDDGPRTLLAVDRDQVRLSILMDRLAPLAAEQGPAAAGSRLLLGPGSGQRGRRAKRPMAVAPTM